MKNPTLLILVVAIVIGFFVWQGAERASQKNPAGPSAVEDGTTRERLSDGSDVSTTTEEVKKDNRKIPTTTREPLTATEMRDIVIAAAKWTQNSQESSGHFRYEYLPVADMYADDDNIVRQMGTMYELGELLVRDSKDSLGLAGTIQESIKYARSESATSTLGVAEFYCVLHRGFQCSTGATALGLIGMIDLVTARPDLESEYESLIEGYKDYLLAMRNPGAGIRGQHFLLRSDEDQSDSESSFFNGEGFLALVRHHQYKPSPEVKKNIDELFDYFVETYGSKPDANFYLWGMAAVKDLYREDPRQEYVNFVKPYTSWRTGAYATLRDSNRNRCAYIEGVVSAYSVVAPSASPDEREKLLEEINFWLSKSVELQIKADGKIPVVVGGSPTTFDAPRPEQAEGGFLTALNVPRQRIDFTQHCLSSYVQKLFDIDGLSL